MERDGIACATSAMSASDDAPAPGARLRLAPGVAVREADLRWAAVRSSGPGGQNVNRRATKVELRVPVAALGLPRRAEARLRRIAGERRLAADDVLLTCQEHRTQRRNREGCLDQLRELVARAIVEPTPRRPTRPTRGSKERRLDAKRRRGEIKRQRRPPPRP